MCPSFHRVLQTPAVASQVFCMLRNQQKNPLQHVFLIHQKSLRVLDFKNKTMLTSAALSKVCESISHQSK